MKPFPPIAVIGAGVIGLSTALRLLQAGFPVEIFAKEFSPSTHSDRAGAVWFPFHSGPVEKVTKWALASYQEFEKLALVDDSGIRFGDFLILKPNVESVRHPWFDALPDPGKLNILTKNVLQSYPFAYKIRTPFIEVPIYMQYLRAQIKKYEGKFIERTLTDFREITSDFVLTINCAGLGAKELAADPALYALKGVTLEIESDDELRAFIDEDSPLACAYIIPRKNTYILGGTLYENDLSLEVDPQDVESILSRCKQIENRLKNYRLTNRKAGLRPARHEIRLEQHTDLPLIHNYGHGGSGFTVSWGCAAEVVEMAKAYCASKSLI